MKLQELKEQIKNIIREEMIQPNTDFVKPILISNKKQLMQSKDSIKLLNTIFAPYKIEFQKSDDRPTNKYFALVGLVGGGVSRDGDTVIEYNSNILNVFKHDNLYNKFIANIIRLISHELIHVDQFNKMRTQNPSKFDNIIDKLSLNVNSNETEKYLSIPQEIMAFAKESVMEFKDKGFSNQKILARLRSPNDLSFDPQPKESAIFLKYLFLFGAKDNVFKRFSNYMYQYLNK